MKNNIFIIFVTITVNFFIIGCDLFYMPPKNMIINNNKPDEYNIIFSRRYNNKNIINNFYTNIYLVNSNGTNLSKITNAENLQTYRFPSISPDGNKILYLFNYEIHVMNYYGPPEIIRLTDIEYNYRDLCPSYSPDGSKIIFIRFFSELNIDTHGDIYIIDSDGENLLPITTAEEDQFYSYPSISPDGNKILYLLDDNIYTMNIDGSGIKQLTDVVSSGDSDLTPLYSPDGSKIIFARRHFFESTDHTASNIYIMDSDGTNLSKITNTTNGYYSYPSISPDGKKILFLFNSNIYIMNIDGSETKQLTDSTSLELNTYDDYHDSELSFIN